MTLHDTQKDFCAYLLDRPNHIEDAISGDMAVYHHAYRAQLLACLKDTFEKCWAWLGDDAFEAAARAHISANPPSSWTLNFYGEGFDGSLAGLYPDDPEITELAWLEWTLRRAFDGADADPIDPAILAEIDWENAVLFFVPTLSVKSLSTNCAAIWTALATGETPPSAEHLPVAGAIRVWRQGLSARFQSIDASEERALRLAQLGASFGDICATLVTEQGDGDGTAEAGRILASWLRDGMITAVSDHGDDGLPMSR